MSKRVEFEEFDFPPEKHIKISCISGMIPSQPIQDHTPECTSDSSYVIVQNGQLALNSKNRPKGQNDPQVQQKVARRIEKDAELAKKNNIVINEKLTEFSQTVKEKGRFPLRAERIDMCHGVSTNVLSTTLVDGLNTLPKIQNKEQAMELAENLYDVVDQVASSGDDESRSTIKDLTQGEGTPQERAKKTNCLLKKLSNSSPGLFPGDASRNRTIQENYDPHTINTDPENPVMLERHAGMKESVDKLHRTLDKPVYSPKITGSGSILSSTGGEIPPHASLTVLTTEGRKTPTSDLLAQGTFSKKTKQSSKHHSDKSATLEL